MQDRTFISLQTALSPARWEAYRPKGGSNADVLLCYLWNLALCESAFCMLQTLEVVFRNALHRSIGEAVKSEDWLLNGPSLLLPPEMETLEKTREVLRRQNKPLIEPRMVAELHFGFWTSLADSRYDRMWPKIIKSAFPSMPNHIRTRGEISARINGVRKLRNAAFHHHSIWHWNNLIQQHENGYVVIGWISPEMEKIARGVDRFHKILSEGTGPFKKLLSIE